MLSKILYKKKNHDIAYSSLICANLGTVNSTNCHIRSFSYLSDTQQ